MAFLASYLISEIGKNLKEQSFTTSEFRDVGTLVKFE